MSNPVVGKASEVEELNLEGGAKIRWLITHKNGAENFSLRLVTIPAGKSTPFHTHDYEHEIFVLEGKGEGTLDDNRATVEKNGFMLIPGGVKHTIKAITEMKIICVVPIRAAVAELGA